MIGKKRRLIALLAALMLMAALFGLLQLHSFLKPLVAPEQLVIRQIDVALPPPPPPPPPIQSSQQSSMDLSSMAVDGQGVSVTLSLQPDSLGDIEQALPLPEQELAEQDWSLDWAQDWSAYAVNDLDAVPRLLSPLHLRFPSGLKSRGVRQALVKLHVLIDEQGRAHLKGVRQNPHPELKSCIDDAIRQARFSVPRKGGEPVKAEFIWPVEMGI